MNNLNCLKTNRLDNFATLKRFITELLYPFWCIIDTTTNTQKNNYTMKNSLKKELRLLRHEIAKANKEIAEVRCELRRLENQRMAKLIEQMQSSARDMALMSNVL